MKQKAAKLLKKLCKDLGSDLNKSNFRYKAEKKYCVSQDYKSNSGHFLLQVDNFNIGGQLIQSVEGEKASLPYSPESPQNKNKSPIINLKDAPKLTCNSHRTSEISTLKKWILESNIQFITIYGLSGIGKSNLACQLIEHVQT